MRQRCTPRSVSRPERWVAYRRPLPDQRLPAGLAHMLDQAAKHQDLENERRIKLLTGILEPAVIVAMGIVVLLIVLAILLPIIEINELVRG